MARDAENSKKTVRNMMQEIIIAGNNVDDVFKLQCVRSVHKNIEGDIIFVLKDGTTAEAGDSIVLYTDKTWTVKKK